MLEQIKASAGSGKTYTLTRRFLEELARLGREEDTLPCRRARRRASGAFSEILAMTFTNKAAAEMKARVLSALKRIALRACQSGPDGPVGADEPDPETGISPRRALEWVNLILRRYDSLNIRTIDSFLNLLLQISAINLDIPPDFELAFDEREFLDPLYDELLDRAARGDAEISALLRECALYLLDTNSSAGLLPRGRIRHMLLNVLEKVQTLRPEDLPCTDRDRLETGRAAALEDLCAALRALEAELERLDLAPSKNFANFMQKLWNYTPGDEFPSSLLLGRASFQDCCNKAEKGLVDAGLEEAYRDFCAALERLRPRLALYESALQLLPFARLALLLLPEIKRLQRESGRIPASLKERLAGETLNAENGVSEACCRLGTRLNHILIDEFQDTSREQWRALLPLAEECLARGGSLRYVGDVKQAIYSWRGGDSALFDELVEPQSELTAIEPRPRFTPLDYNWRSAPEVVRHNNEFFGRLADPDLAYLVVKALLHKNYPDSRAREAAAVLARAFTGAEQKIPPGKGGGAPGFVRLELVGGAGQTDLQEDIKGKLQTLLADLLRRRAPGEIAILVRNGAEAAMTAAWLTGWGVGVVTEHSFKLAGNPLVQRLVALLRWLDYPADDLNFIGFVCGEEIFGRASGLRPEDVLAWEAGARGSATGRQPLFRRFMADFPAEWAIWLEPFYRRGGLMSAYDMVSEIYNRFSLLAAAPGHAVYLRRFLELVLGAERAGFSSLSGFLEFWDDKGLEEKIPAPENPEAVRLMTIHKAKGLEFPVVILPFHRFGGRDAAEAALCGLDGLNVLVKSGPSLGEAYYRSKNGAAVEIMNLLYVGWTRAGEELHAFIGGSEHDRTSAGLTKALELLLDGYNFSREGVYCAGEVAKPSENMEDTGGGREAPAFSACPAPQDEDWQPMGWLPKLKIFRSPVPESVYDERVRGILFHNCLENLYIGENIENNPDELNLDELLERTVDFSLRAFRLPLSRAEAARAELAEALGWFCALPRARYWLARGRAEQSIMDADGANYRMDRLVEEEDGSWLVLEYKSGRARPEYADQLRRYLRLLQAGSGRPARGLLVYLDEKRLEGVSL